MHRWLCSSGAVGVCSGSPSRRYPSSQASQGQAPRHRWCSGGVLVNRSQPCGGGDMFHQKELILGECYHTNHERNAFEKQKATHIKYQRKVKIKGSKYPTVFHIQEEMGCLSKSSFHRVVWWKSDCNGSERK